MEFDGLDPDDWFEDESEEEGFFEGEELADGAAELGGELEFGPRLSPIEGDDEGLLLKGFEIKSG